MAHEWRIALGATARIADNMQLTVESDGSATGVYNVETLLKSEVLRLAAENRRLREVLRTMGGFTENPSIVAGRGIREATEEAGLLHLHSAKDEPPAVTIGEVEEWKRRTAEARLYRLDALLSSEEVPEGLRTTLGALTPVYAESAWRWFREQLG